MTVTERADADDAVHELEVVADRFFRQRIPDPHASAADPAAAYAALRPAMVELGWLDLPGDPDFGGPGAPRLVSGILRAAGRALAPGRLVEDLVIRPLLGSAAEGAFAFVNGAEVDGWDRSHRQLRVEGDRLVGHVDAVAHAGEADWLLVAAAAEDGPVVLAVPADAPGVVVEPGSTLDPCSTVAAVRLDLAVLPGWVVDHGPGARRTLESVLAHARLATSAELLGLSSEMLRKAVAYAGQREQFGRPIGSFQAVKHLLAEMAVEVDSLANLVADVVDGLPADDADLRRRGAVVKVHASRVAVSTANRALQVHGGIGFTEEYALQLYIKRALELRYGAAYALSAELGADLIARREVAQP